MISATDISKLLSLKHKDDICIPECKTGSQWEKRNIRHIDMWVMKPSWTNPIFWGYEIKVSRQDFIRDEKWRNYLPYCTDFYFVAPPGVIEPNELPEECGLLVTSKNCKKLYTKKKAPSRKVDVPVDIFKYILMWRTKVTRREILDNEAYWKNYIEDKLHKHEVGSLAGYKIKKMVDKKVEEIKDENRQLRNENDRLQSIKKMVFDMGYTEKDLKGFNIEYSFKRKLQEIKDGVPGGLSKFVKEAQQKLAGIEAIIEA